MEWSWDRKPSYYMWTPEYHKTLKQDATLYRGKLGDLKRREKKFGRKRPSSMRPGGVTDDESDREWDERETECSLGMPWREFLAQNDGALQEEIRGEVARNYWASNSASSSRDGERFVVGRGNL